MLSDRIPDLRALELLDSIARTGSITLAAGELGVSQQAASLRLRRLEERLGRQLVIRETRSSRLTDDGRVLLDLSRRMLDAAADLDVALDGLMSSREPLAVAASLTVAEHFLPRWIGAYLRNGNDAGAVRLRATNTREVVRIVSDGDADIGFVEGDAPPRGLHYAFLAFDTLAVYVSPRHPWAATGHVSPWTLAATPLVTRETGSGCRAVVLSTLRGHGVEDSHFAEPALELPSNTAVLEAAAAGVAPAVISTIPAAQYLSDRRLVRITVDHVAFRRQLGAVWQHGQEPSTPAARELLRAARAGRADRVA